MKLPEETLVFPAHDYKGETVSTIGEEKRFNPRLQVKSIDEYVELMNNLKLPNPKMMDVAVPANLHVGLHQEEVAKRGWALTAAQTMKLLDRPDIALVDLRETNERDKHGVIRLAACPHPLQTCAQRSARRQALCAGEQRGQADRLLLRLPASAPRWRCRRRKTQAYLPAPATSPAVSMRGRRRKDDRQKRATQRLGREFVAPPFANYHRLKYIVWLL